MCDGRGNRRDRFVFALENFRYRIAVALAHDDNYLALAALVFLQAAVATVLFVAPRFHIATEVSAIDFDFAGKLCRQLRCERLADFVRKNECRFVLNVEIARELERAMPFRAVHEYRNRREDVPEPRAGRDTANSSSPP